MSNVYGESFISDGKVQQWCRNFEAGRTDVHDAGGQERKRVSTYDFVQGVDQAIRENCRLTISVFSDLFPKISRSALYTIALCIWQETIVLGMCVFQCQPTALLCASGSTQGG